jgi:hypothetical protein
MNPIHDPVSGEASPPILLPADSLAQLKLPSFDGSVTIIPVAALPWLARPRSRHLDYSRGRASIIISPVWRLRLSSSPCLPRR